jgi:hypothetical protein
MKYLQLACAAGWRGAASAWRGVINGWLFNGVCVKYLAIMMKQ